MATLEEIANAGKRFNQIFGIARAHQADPTSPEVVDALIQYDGGSQIPPKARNIIMDLSPTALQDRYMRPRVREAKEKLVEKVNGNLDAILEKLDEESLLSLATGLPDPNRKYTALEQKIAEKDYDAAVAMYLADVPDTNNVWTQRLSELGTETVLSFAKEKLSREKREFLSQFVEGDKIKKEKLISYVKGLVKDENRTEMYAQIGSYYAQRSSE